MPLVLAGGCDGIQSALSPAGTGATQIADLFWVMTGAAAVIWVVVLGIAVYATRVRPRPHPQRTTRLLIIGGGIVLPTIVLCALLIYGLRLMPPLRADDGGLRIDVSGEQWWWRVTYRPTDAEPVASANEIRVPRGERIEIAVSSPDVIHSFWIPSLGGKMDMIPGRVNHLVLEPTQTGEFRGVCAEFCGTSHALMAFSVVVMEPEDFERWLDRQSEPAAAPVPAAEEGAALFQAYGCGGCHRIGGTDAKGVIGPDLTHVGGRRTIAAGILPNTSEAMARWISHPREIKPAAHMPAFGMAPERDIQAIAGYLGGLE